MGIDHRGTDITMAQEFLNRADIVAVFQQMGGEALRKVWGVAGLVTAAF
jgi:hypothetical protein